MYQVLLSVLSYAVLGPRYSQLHVISIVIKLYQIKIKFFFVLVVLR